MFHIRLNAHVLPAARRGLGALFVFGGVAVGWAVLSGGEAPLAASSASAAPLAAATVVPTQPKTPVAILVRPSEIDPNLARLPPPTPAVGCSRCSPRVHIESVTPGTTGASSAGVNTGVVTPVPAPGQGQNLVGIPPVMAATTTPSSTNNSAGSNPAPNTPAASGNSISAEPASSQGSGVAPLSTPGPIQPPVPSSAPIPGPDVPHDQAYYSATGFRIDDDGILSYFQTRGQIDTFGLPVSRTFVLQGCRTQIFQRQIAQNCGGAVQLMNVLDPDIFPYTSVNGSAFPPTDDSLKNQTPAVGSADYATAILAFVRANAPEIFAGQPTSFQSTFFSSVSAQQAGTDDPNLLGLFDLEIWGAPISRPAADPNNPSFIYQRFQRGIMHYIAGQGTRGLLLADYVKQIMLGSHAKLLPPDLRVQAQGSKYFDQYCPGAFKWLCRPDDLPGTDLTNAFEEE